MKTWGKAGAFRGRTWGFLFGSAFLPICGLRGALMRPGRAVPWLVVLLWTACAATPLRASDLHPLTISMVESSGDKYFEPAGRRIVIRSQPIHLFIRIRNTSETAVSIRTRPDKAYSIELKDETGLTVVVKRTKNTSGDSDDDIRVNLSPGAEKIISVDISRDTWEGVPDLKAGKESKYTARVIYEAANEQLIYSEAYTLIFILG